MRRPKAEFGSGWWWKLRDASASGGGARLHRLMLVGILSGVPLAVVAQEEKPQDDDESKRRLIRKTRGESDNDVMVRIIDGMARAGHRLGESFDAGEATQAVQRQIVKDLDLAIRQARQNLRTRRSSAQSQGERRTEGETSDQPPDKGAQGKSGDEPSDSDPSGPGGGNVEVGLKGALQEARRQWGHLPPRDRDEIMQGANEESHEKYREQIERYYELLADPKYDQ